MQIITTYEERKIEFNTVKELDKELEKYKKYELMYLKKGYDKDSLYAQFYEPQKKYVLTIRVKTGEKYE